MTEELMISIPHPYKGLSLRFGTREANVHEVRNGQVFYGMYDDNAFKTEYHCTGLYRLSEDDWINRSGRALLDGALIFSRIEPEPYCLEP